MEKITEVTRRDILDAIRDGFEVLYDEPEYFGFDGEFETGYEVKMPFYGRLDEISFFTRIYDLEKLPSHDRRYENALGDIRCHLHWGDYPEECWFFDDERFQLRHGDGDEPLLRFMCEMLHPSVRNENSQWKDYLDKFNSLLRVDGYELYPAQLISGRALYKARCYVEPVAPTLPAMLFSERYKSLIEYGNGLPVDQISNIVSHKAKKHLAQVMFKYQEPMQYRPSRYDNWTENTDALEEATQRLNKFLDIDAINSGDPPITEEQGVAGMFTPFLFNLIEFQYDELSSSERTEFRKEINASFQGDGVPFHMADSGLIERTADYEPLTSEIVPEIEKIRELGLKELLDLAIEKHRQSDLQSHRDATEKLWAAFERLKTYYPELRKNISADKVIEAMSGNQKEFIELFTTEFKALTDIGNSFSIRHHETSQVDVKDMRYYDYFFNRCLSLIALAIQYLE